MTSVRFGRDLSNADGVEKAIRALTKAGRLQAEDVVFVTTARHLARALDDQPDNASLWRQYRDALNDLMSRGADSGDGFTALQAEIRNATGADS